MLFLASGTIFSYVHILFPGNSHLSVRTQLKTLIHPGDVSAIPRLFVVLQSCWLLLKRFPLKNVFALFKNEKKKTWNNTNLDSRLIFSFHRFKSIGNQWESQLSQQPQIPFSFIPVSFHSCNCDHSPDCCSFFILKYSRLQSAWYHTQTSDEQDHSCFQKTSNLTGRELSTNNYYIMEVMQYYGYA